MIPKGIKDLPLLNKYKGLYFQAVLGMKKFLIVSPPSTTTATTTKRHK
jgi:hypothetical protein